MKKKTFITILIIFILLMCSMIGVWIFVHPKDTTITLAKDNSINENTIDISTNTISDEVESESNIIIAESELETEPKIEPDEEYQKQDDIVVEKTSNKPSSPTITSTTSTNKNTQKNKTNTTQISKNTTTQSTTSPSNVENTKTTDTTTTKPVDKPTETKPVTQPTRCTHNNNHGMDVGNCGKWFSSKSDAISYYEEKINYWGKLWESYQIEDSEYYKNCPTGYEYWSCMYCNKWTINLYYR